MDTTTNVELIDITPEESHAPVYLTNLEPIIEPKEWDNPEDMIQAQQDKKNSAIQKLIALGLDEAEALALIGQ